MTDPRCPVCIDHPGWAHGDRSRRAEPLDVCRSCYGSGTRLDPAELGPAGVKDNLAAEGRPLSARSSDVLHYLRQQPGRCRSCGYHAVTQGHAADCEALS